MEQQRATRGRRRRMWGIIPAAGAGQPDSTTGVLKGAAAGGEPCGGRSIERPRAISEYLVERMIRGGANKLCFVISPGKTDILSYYGSRLWGCGYRVCGAAAQPGGLCDAVFRALPLISPDDESVMIGLPDTLWEPEDGFRADAGRMCCSFLLFEVQRPELFDAVVTDAGRVGVLEIEVKTALGRRSNVDLGCDQDAGECAARAPRAVVQAREGRDEYLGHAGERVDGGGWASAGSSRMGEGYVDTGYAGWVPVGDSAARG